MDRAPKLPLDSPLLRFGPKAEVLAEALHMMSLSLVKMVLGYLVHPTATAGAKPKKLLNVSTSNAPVYAVACSPDNKLWMAGGHRVQIFSDDGKLLDFATSELRLPGHGPNTTFDEPRGLAFDAAGNAYICDWGANRVVACRLDGRFVRQIGSEGRGVGQFNRPSHLAVDCEQSLLFVNDSLNGRVCVLNVKEGYFVKSFACAGRGNWQLRPGDLAVHASGELCVIDQRLDCVQAFDYNGRYLRTLDCKGAPPGQMRQLRGLAFDAAGNWISCSNGNLACVWSRQMEIS